MRNCWEDPQVTLEVKADWTLEVKDRPRRFARTVSSTTSGMADGNPLL